MKNIILIGMPGAGKSTVGVVLAKTAGMQFVDTDLVLQQKTGRKLQEIINSDGIKKFLQAEETVISSLECENCVIATGGSAVLSEKAMSHLKKNGTVVYLDVPIEEIKNRIDNITTRGIAMNPEESIDTVFRERLPLYKKYADIALSAGKGNLEATVEKLFHICEAAADS